MPLKPAEGEPTMRERYEACKMAGMTVKEAADYLEVTTQASASAYWRLENGK